MKARSSQYWCFLVTADRMNYCLAAYISETELNHPQPRKLPRGLVDVQGPCYILHASAINMVVVQLVKAMCTCLSMHKGGCACGWLKSDGAMAVQTMQMGQLLCLLQSLSMSVLGMGGNKVATLPRAPFCLNLSFWPEIPFVRSLLTWIFCEFSHCRECSKRNKTALAIICGSG